MTTRLTTRPEYLRVARPRLAVLLLACATGLGACTAPPRASKPVAPTAPPAPVNEAPPPAPTPPPPPAPPAELAAEARWLQEWFGNTPVKVSLDDQGLVRLSVPAVHAFASGATAPKPALKAVLDRVIQSLVRKPNAKVTVTVPSGVAGREAAVRKHFTSQGLAAWRVSVQGSSPDADTEMLISPGQAPVRTVEDDKLPPPPAPKPVKPAPPRPAASR